MSWDGFIPDDVIIPCKFCGNNLESKDSGYPASRYFGTLNGLCNKCTYSCPFLKKRYSDEAEIWSFPPHCPSWRRNRETYIKYNSCKNKLCNHGSVYISRPDAYGGSYLIQCSTCSQKYYTHWTR